VQFPASFIAIAEPVERFSYTSEDRAASFRRADVHLPVALHEVIQKIEGVRERERERERATCIRALCSPVQSRVGQVKRRGRTRAGNEAEIDWPTVPVYRPYRAERTARLWPRVEPRRRATYYHRLGAVGVGAGACERCDICGVSLSLIGFGRAFALLCTHVLLHVYIPIRFNLPRDSPIHTLRARPPRGLLWSL